MARRVVLALTANALLVHQIADSMTADHRDRHSVLALPIAVATVRPRVMVIATVLVGDQTAPTMTVPALIATKADASALTVHRRAMVPVATVTSADDASAPMAHRVATTQRVSATIDATAVDPTVHLVATAREAIAVRAANGRRTHPAHRMVTDPIRPDHPQKSPKNPAPKTPFEPLSLAPGPLSLVPAKSGPGCFFLRPPRDSNGQSGRAARRLRGLLLPLACAVSILKWRHFRAKTHLRRGRTRTPRCIYGQWLSPQFDV
jgi:hypothetical protein